MNFECSLGVRMYKKKTSKILQRFGWRCHHVFVCAALFGENPTQVLLVKRVGEDDRVREVEPVADWTLPGSLCTSNDPDILTRLAGETFAHIGVSITKFTSLVCRETVAITTPDNVNQRVLVLTFAAEWSWGSADSSRHVGDYLSRDRYSLHY
ncbi:hypothetical protein ANO14919_051620 [Xylariales sp. No.14919]|nr:hypothetical protein ANO14919_051620 [Xylariales sp. No.14919]